MVSSEYAVRDAAEKLHAAIVAAEQDGYRIAWPDDAAGLLGIAVSETGQVKPAEMAEPAAEPAPEPALDHPSL